MRKLILSVLTGFAASGCAPFATYPPDEGSMIDARGDTEPVPALMAEAIRYAHEQDHSVASAGGDFAYNLPPGTNGRTYAVVKERLRGIGHPQTSLQEQAYHVTKVRVRGRRAMVDVFYPKTDGGYQFETVTFLGDLWVGYKVESSRLWQTDDQPPAPSWMPPAPSEEEAIQRVLATDRQR